MTKKLVISILILITLMCNSGVTPLDPAEALKRQQYDFAVAYLDAYFIFREQLPPDLYAFSNPKKLYESVKERWTAYYDREETRIFMTYLTTTETGIGVRIGRAAKGCCILNIYQNGPAEKAGLKTGDTITAINSKNIAGNSLRDIEWFLQGEKGSVVNVTVMRDTNQLSYQVTRDFYMSPSVFVDSLDSATASIVIMAFLEETNTAGGTAVEFKNALNTIPWSKNLIIDLRGNGGGMVDQCKFIAGSLIGNDKPMVNVKTRAIDEKKQLAYTNDTIYYSIGNMISITKKMCILVDRNTASASEMLVSALKNDDPSINIIGDTTFGKGRGQIIAFGPDSVLVKITSLTISNMNGSSYDNIGISPDILSGNQDARDVAVKMYGGKSTGLSKEPGRDGYYHKTKPLAIVKVK